MQEISHSIARTGIPAGWPDLSRADRLLCAWYVLCDRP